MVRADEQGGGVGEGFVVDEHGGVEVAVRGDDREILRVCEQAAGDVADARFRRKQPVRVVGV